MKRRDITEPWEAKRFILKSLALDRTVNASIERTRDDAGHTLGRVIAQSTFHHFVDYNWDIDKGCPSFVEEPPGTEVKDDPSGLQDIYAYVKNVALWLAPTAI